jgi:sulfoxide reductase heme-binding subunit YedZ
MILTDMVSSRRKLDKALKGLKLSPLKVLVHLTAWGLLVWLLFDYLTGNLTVNPIQAATQRTGFIALSFLSLSLACTPLNTVFGWRQTLKVRRILGLYAFMYAFIHFTIFIWLDYGFDWGFLKVEIINKRFVLVGAGAFLILAVLALTSFRWWMKRLGKNWKRLHKLVYLAGMLVILHYAWAKKGDLLRLSGDILGPLAFGLILGILLAVRIPAVRRSARNLRDRLARATI